MPAQALQKRGIPRVACLCADVSGLEGAQLRADTDGEGTQSLPHSAGNGEGRQLQRFQVRVARSGNQAIAVRPTPGLDRRSQLGARAIGTMQEGQRCFERLLWRTMFLTKRSPKVALLLLIAAVRVAAAVAAAYIAVTVVVVVVAATVHCWAAALLLLLLLLRRYLYCCCYAVVACVSNLFYRSQPPK